MKPTLYAGVILDVPEPFTFQVRLEDGRDVIAIPSRFHFEHTPNDLARVQSLRQGVPVMVRVAADNPAGGWLVRIAGTEEDWQRSTEPATLLETVRSTASERQLRLFACACCVQIEELLSPGPHRRLLEVLKSCTEGKASAADVKAAATAGDPEEKHFSDAAEEAEADPVKGPEAGAAAKAIWAVRIAAAPAQGKEVFETALDAARCCAEAMGLRAKARAAARAGASGEMVEHERALAEAAAFRAQAEIVRKVFGSPFKAVVASP